MSTNIVCPTCGRGLTAPPEAAGKVCRCPHCSTQFKLVAVATPAPAAVTAIDQDPALEAFLSGSQRPAITPRQAVVPRQQRKSLVGPLSLSIGFLLVVAVVAIWAFNAARTVSQFSRAISGHATTSNAVTPNNFYRVQTGMTYLQVVGILGTEGELMSQNQLDMLEFEDGQLRYSTLDTRMYIRRGTGAWQHERDVPERAANSEKRSWGCAEFQLHCFCHGGPTRLRIAALINSNSISNFPQSSLFSFFISLTRSPSSFGC